MCLVDSCVREESLTQYRQHPHPGTAVSEPPQAIILEITRAEHKLPSRLRNDGKWNSGNQRNYRWDCLLFSFSGATSSPLQLLNSKEIGKIKAVPISATSIHLHALKNQGAPYCQWGEMRAGRVHRSPASESAALGGYALAAEIMPQGFVWDFPPSLVWFCFFSYRRW